MLAKASSSARGALEHVLHELYGNVPLDIQPAAGGFVVAVVSPDHADEPAPDATRALLERIWKANARIADSHDRVVVFSFRVYRDVRALYNQRGTLRTQPLTYQNGVMTRLVVAGDASVLAHWVDAEALLLDRGSRRTCRVVLDPDFKSPVALDPDKYVEFDLGGLTFPVRNVDAADEGIWRVLLG